MYSCLRFTYMYVVIKVDSLGIAHTVVCTASRNELETSPSLSASLTDWLATGACNNDTYMRTCLSPRTRLPAQSYPFTTQSHSTRSIRYQPRYCASLHVHIKIAQLYGNAQRSIRRPGAHETSHVKQERFCMNRFSISLAQTPIAFVMFLVG